MVIFVCSVNVEDCRPNTQLMKEYYGLQTMHQHSVTEDT